MQATYANGCITLKPYICCSDADTLFRLLGETRNGHACRLHHDIEGGKIVISFEASAPVKPEAPSPTVKEVLFTKGGAISSNPFNRYHDRVEAENTAPIPPHEVSVSIEVDGDIDWSWNNAPISEPMPKDMGKTGVIDGDAPDVVYIDDRTDAFAETAVNIINSLGYDELVLVFEAAKNALNRMVD